MSKTTCRFATSHTMKLAEEVFEGDVAAAWAVIPSFMEENNIVDESTITAAELKEYWNKQTERKQQEILSYIPNPKIVLFSNNDSKGKIGAEVINGEVIFNSIEKLSTLNYMTIWYSQHLEELKTNPAILDKIHTPKDILKYELFKVKYDNIYGDSKTTKEKIDLALNNLSLWQSLSTPSSIGYTLVNTLSNNELIEISSNNEISIKRDISEEEFFNYILGNDSSSTSEQKKLIINKLASDYKISEEDLRSILNNPYLRRQFLYLTAFYRTKHNEDVVNRVLDDNGTPVLDDPINVAIGIKPILYALGTLTNKGYAYPNIAQMLKERTTPTVTSNSQEESNKGQQVPSQSTDSAQKNIAKQGYEVSTAGDYRFSALRARFGPNTTFLGVDISGYSIEEVYQTLVKLGTLSRDWKQGKGKAPAKGSLIDIDSYAGEFEGSGQSKEIQNLPEELHNALADYFMQGKSLTPANIQDFSYYMAYKPLWDIWASQNPQLIEDLRQKSQGKILTDKFAGHTRVTQARALSDILKETSSDVDNQTKVETFKGNWTREQVAKQTDKVFLFGDNTDDRLNTHHVPSSTQAVIRGLDNAIGIDTKMNRGTSERPDRKSSPGRTAVISSTVLHSEDLKQKDSERQDYSKVAKKSKLLNGLETIFNNPMTFFDVYQSLPLAESTKRFIEQTLGLTEQLFKEAQDANLLFSKEQNEVKKEEYRHTILEYLNKVAQAEHKILSDEYGINAEYGLSKLSANDNSSFLSDDDLEGFKIIVDSAIQKAKDSGKTIVIPEGGIGTGKAMLKEKAPKLFQYLQDQLNALQSNPTLSSQTQGSQSSTQDMDDDYLAYLAAMEGQGASSTSQDTHPQETQQQVTVDDYQLPDIDTSEVVQADTNSPLYRMSMQMDVTQINNRVNMISRRISEGITRAISKKIRELTAKINKGEASEDDIMLFAQLSDEEEGRKFGIPLVINDVLKEVKQDIQETYDDMENLSSEEIFEEFGFKNGEYIRDQYKILLENYNDLFDMACDALENSEQVVLTRTADKVTSKKSTADQTLEDRQLNDAEEGSRATGNEGYSFSARMLDPHMSSRAVTRRILSGLHQVNYKGEFELDDLGEMVFVPEAVAYSSLLNDLTKLVHHPEDFNIRHKDGTYSYPALEKLAETKYPWIKEILNKLHKNPNLGSALYTDLCKEYVQYWTQYDAEVTDKDGKTTIERQTKRANAPVARQSIMDKVNAAYNEHAVTTGSMIWNKEGNIVEENANDVKERANTIIDAIKTGEPLDSLTEEIADILNAIGIDTNPNEIKNLINDSAEGRDKILTLATNIGNIVNGAIKLDVNNSLVNEYRGAYESIADIIGVVNELHNAITFRQGDADFPSYTTPNFINFIKNGIKDQENWAKFLMEEFAYDDFLYDKEIQEFKSFWLELFRTDKEVRDSFDIKYVNIIDGKEYEDWTHDDIIKNFIFEYNSVPIGSGKQYAYYSFPIFSDSTIASFVKMPRFIRNFKEEVTERLVGLAKQEISRINKVKKRAAAKASQIQRFDSTGDKFLFIPELNDYEVSEGVKLLDYINSLASDNVDEANRVLSEAIRSIMQDNFNNFWKKNRNIFKDKFAKKDPNNPAVEIVDSKLEAQTKKGVEEFFWNNALAQSQIIQLMTTDLAYYKDYTDFQKRFKEVYASGARLNTQSKYGRKTERTIYLADKIITSPSYDGLKKSLMNAYENGLMSIDEVMSILEKAKNINAVDAQAYRTLSSYRAVLDMQGKWTPAMENAFDRFSRGEWSNEDFNLVWGVIKPFLFANVKTSDGVGGYQRVPHQNKNSEFLLLSFLNGFNLGNQMRNSPQLRGLNRAMEDFQIDVAMFQSAVKAGGQGIIDISYSREALDNAMYGKKSDRQYDEEGKPIESSSWKSLMESAKKELGKDFSDASNFEKYKAAYDNLLDTESITQEEYNKAINDMAPSEDEIYEIIRSAIYDQETANPTDLFEESEDTRKIENKNVIHEMPYEHYMIAQPTVNHLVDTESVFGSQFRNMIKSDLPEDFEITIRGKTYKAKNAEGKNEIVELYDNLLIENLLDNWEDTTKLFGDIETLQGRLMEMVKGNPSYGPDILNALQLVTIDGVKQFNIPPHNTTVANKIEQLILSVFKNSVTKQHIKGAACVLVSSFGFDKDLKIHRDANGAITAFECLMPAHTKILFQDFLVPVKDKDSKVIGQEIDIKRCPKELLEGIGFRIPTEAKYSMANIIIKGFLPQQNGAVLMLPAETTMLAGEDYDKLSML